ncbi:hypothetical protein KDD30_23305 (plasmid) [Photobacterium sp. GJ3]|uniref:hypothetical protein n=1 Tax=Photobacterium sp. GJ3 TaxID=2829502 RepID=UPI001B8BFFE9|nr:hypothetical protein [Photobacterium sp. GJ3]QUJ69660.1 hypothetical protein KDD30_23305 [Photobacterium sp. GJ3]
MESLSFLLFLVYLAIGGLATLYALVFFFLTGLTIFDQGKKQAMPFRHKCSYVFVMLLLMPLFFPVFMDEIISLSEYYLAKKNALAQSGSETV